MLKRHCLYCLLFFPLAVFSQVTDVKDAGPFLPGKVRITRNEIEAGTRSGAIRHIRFRTFTVDSVPGEMGFGNHYRNLKNIVKQDDEASIYLVNATHWERNQRICLGATAVGLGVALLVPMNQKAFNTTMYINVGAATGILVSYFCKRHWANKSIRTWNRHLDEGKFRYAP
jgi:hypothetical protein